MVRLFLREVYKLGTDPTYKEWKPNFVLLDDKFFIEHGSYLQGMETILFVAPELYLSTHGSYLQGMETKKSGRRKALGELRTDPTYKEWKPRRTSGASS